MKRPLFEQIPVLAAAFGSHFADWMPTMGVGSLENKRSPSTSAVFGVGFMHCCGEVWAFQMEGHPAEGLDHSLDYFTGQVKEEC